MGFRYAGTHVDTTDAPKAPQPVRGRCATWPGMMKSLLILAHYAEVALHMHNYGEDLYRVIVGSATEEPESL